MLAGTALAAGALAPKVNPAVPPDEPAKLVPGASGSALNIVLVGAGVVAAGGAVAAVGAPKAIVAAVAAPAPNNDLVGGTAGGAEGADDGSGGAALKRLPPVATLGTGGCDDDDAAAAAAGTAAAAAGNAAVVAALAMGFNHPGATDEEATAVAACGGVNSEVAMPDAPKVGTRAAVAAATGEAKPNVNTGATGAAAAAVTAGAAGGATGIAGVPAAFFDRGSGGGSEMDADPSWPQSAITTLSTLVSTTVGWGLERI